MRSHKDFLPELDLVLELDNQIIGNIMYTKAKLVDESGKEKEIRYGKEDIHHGIRRQQIRGRVPKGDRTPLCSGVKSLYPHPDTGNGRFSL